MRYLTALHEPYFWALTALVAACLAAAWGLLLWSASRGRRVEDLRRLFWSWVVLAGVLTPAVLVGGEVFALVLVPAAILACREFARATGLYEDWVFTALVYLAILGVNAVAVIPNANAYDFFMATPIYAIALFCVLPVMRNRSEGMLQLVALAVMGFVYFGFFLAHLSLLAGCPDPHVSRYLLFVVYGAASAGLAGRLVHRWLGRHPMLTRISKDTSWEGAGAACGWAFLWCFTLGWWTFPGHPSAWLILLVCGVLFGPVNLLGELALRYIERDFGVKPEYEGLDFSPSLTLDHLHRLLFTAPLFFRLLHWFLPELLMPAG
jgi:phosphatidate cytidylyltransferase